MSELPRREPQQSEEARRDRALSWSGRIVPPAAPTCDLDLMQRVRDGLDQLDEGDPE